MPRSSGRAPRLIAVLLLGVMLFNFPLLAVFNVKARLWGIPMLYVYLFMAWATVIALVYWVVERHSGARD
jgi:Na+-driven multidrug efflux pump